MASFVYTAREIRNRKTSCYTAVVTDRSLIFARWRPYVLP